MEYTTNYKLKKPGDQDNVLVGDLNENMDTVDATMKKLSDGKANLDPDTGKVPDNELPDDLFLKLIGGTMKGTIAMGNYRIINLSDPANNQDAATKAYVDALDAKVLASGYGKLSVGKYTGNGNYGASNPTKITFPFAPKYVHVFSPATPSQERYFFWAEGVTEYFAASYWGDISVSGKTLIWYTTGSSAHAQLNASGTTYYYVGLG